MSHHISVTTSILFCSYFLLFISFASSSQNICNEAETYQCEDYQTCCQFADENYGCCPYSYANCCPKTNSCCPSGFACSNNGTSCTRLT
uniref:GRANULINS domain-containing protein n=1 Tax=Panagrellus redivivus TaxID=6233 RepID=A0A7E4UR60_PANRE